MNIYLVGGAVRDQLLGHEVKERDWVVVGGSPAMMEARGFKPVGQSFPVFIHPETGEEYALARTERKKGHGYKGFTFYTGPDITLETDLKRRDLTINAMALDDKGQLIDPYGGYQDLKNKTLKHVCEAFAEDPLRVLRVARFAARLPDFHVAGETQQLMQALVDSGELNYLEPQRVWREVEKALNETAPYRLFEVLYDCGGLTTLMPELTTQKHSIHCLRQGSYHGLAPELLWACLLYPCPRSAVNALQQRLALPKRFASFASSANETSLFWREHKPPTAENLIQWLESIDAYRRPERFERILTVCQACEANGNGIVSNARHALNVTREITAQTMIAQGYQGKAIAKALHTARINALQANPPH